MEAKKRLARAIVGGYYDAGAVRAADEGWARQFQRDEEPEHVEEIAIAAGGLGWTEGTPQVRLDKLLVQLGLADSATDATRKLKQGAVRIGGEPVNSPHLPVASLPATVVLRVGKRIRAAVLDRV